MDAVSSARQEVKTVSFFSNLLSATQMARHQYRGAVDQLHRKLLHQCLHRREMHAVDVNDQYGTALFEIVFEHR